VMRHHREPRRLIALFVNPDLVARSSTWRLDPALWAGDVPPPLTDYTLTKFTARHDRMAFSGSTHDSGIKTVNVDVEAGGVVAIVIDFGEPIVPPIEPGSPPPGTPSP
jgi:hypothetical protein